MDQRVSSSTRRRSAKKRRKLTIFLSIIIADKTPQIISDSSRFRAKDLNFGVLIHHLETGRKIKENRSFNSIYIRSPRWKIEKRLIFLYLPEEKLPNPHRRRRSLEELPETGTASATPSHLALTKKAERSINITVIEFYIQIHILNIIINKDIVGYFTIF